MGGSVKRNANQPSRRQIERIFKDINSKKFDNAIMEVNKLILRFPNSASAHNISGVLYDKMGLFHDAAEIRETLFSNSKYNFDNYHLGPAVLPSIQKQL
jgi:outer membrane protein assembly factor BamD (BamD/ComL family)